MEEVSFTSSLLSHPSILFTSNLYADALVSYYHQHLWCHAQDGYGEGDGGKGRGSEVAALCSRHKNETLFDHHDLEAFLRDPQYFSHNPERLFVLEGPFRQLARAWANRLEEDDEAVVRIVTRAIDARVLEAEYPNT